MIVYEEFLTVETRTYSDFSGKLHEQAVAQRIPLNGTIELTRRCPLTCIHCYNNLPIGDRRAELDELSYEEHCRILDDITEAGCLWLLYTGGEIFIRRDFLDIYTYAEKKGLLLTLFTNGTLITPKIADDLARLRPFSIEISLYGRTKETHERITGVPGSFEKCIRALRLLTERSLPLSLKTVVITENKHEIWEMKRFAEEDLGLEFRFDAMINPRIDGHRRFPSTRLSPEEIIELDLKDTKRMAEWKRFAAKYNGPVHSPEHAEEAYHCGAGINAFAIDPAGKLSLCSLSSGETWDLRTGSFREGWEQSLLKVRQKGTKRVTKCSACEIKAMCRMCPASGELESGDPEEPVDFLCQVAHLRAQSLGFTLKPHGMCEYCGSIPRSTVRPSPEAENGLSMPDGDA